MELDFGQLVKETREDKERKPFVLKLGDGRKPIEIHDVPARLFLELPDMEHGVVSTMFSIVEKLFEPQVWEKRVFPVLSVAPLAAVEKLFSEIMDHFNLVFGESEAAGKSEESNESED